jgi:hypothetical protein
MALTYLQMYDLAVQSSELKNRTKVALSDAIPDVFNEDAGTTNHAERYVWAQYASNNLEQVRDQFMWFIVAHPMIEADGEAISDSDLKAVVSSFIDMFALFYYNHDYTPPA